MEWVNTFKDQLPALITGVVIGASCAWVVAQYAQSAHLASLQERVDERGRENTQLEVAAKDREALISSQTSQIRSLQQQVTATQQQLAQAHTTPSLAALIGRLEDAIRRKKQEISASYNPVLRITKEGAATPVKSTQTVVLEGELAELSRQLDAARARQISLAQP